MQDGKPVMKTADGACVAQWVEYNEKAEEVERLRVRREKKAAWEGQCGTGMAHVCVQKGPSDRGCYDARTGRTSTSCSCQCIPSGALGDIFRTRY
jgi:hypothetical protein